MLSDRPYMRDDYPRNRTTVLTWLISAIVAMFVLQHLLWRLFNADTLLDQLLGLSVANLKAGRIWTLVTYSFLHSKANFLHIIANLLGLYFVGRVLLPVLGSRRFLGLYAAAVGLGGALWLGTHWSAGTGTLIGASAGVLGLFMLFACLNPNQPMTFLLFFIVPVTLRPKYVAAGLLAFELLGFGFYEVMGAVSPFGAPLAHSAHLGGMLAGWVFFRTFHASRGWFRPSRPDVELPRWMQKTPKAAPPPVYQVDVTKREDLRAEVDRILDKINSHGFGALTEEEKRLLDEARDLLSRR
ncbi:Rhomboid family protein [Opitutus terrae PB90-1]|uniref:Rhomboid family protein n=2 Tax=Opitutus terrae TaxID=107709 RepID=B1ZVA5_OPITP|nr:Rhomboid family protein [Opitutus terrae PB90-1]